MKIFIIILLLLLSILSINIALEGYRTNRGTKSIEEFEEIKYFNARGSQDYAIEQKKSKPITLQ